MSDTGEPSPEAVILLVDDNRMDVELTLDAFREVHLHKRLTVAHDGEAALSYLLGQGEHADRERYPLPDLILLDLKMPGIDGFEVLRRIKATPTLRRIPIVVLTSSIEEGHRVMSYDNGANSYLVKPVPFPRFVEVLRHAPATGSPSTSARPGPATAASRSDA